MVIERAKENPLSVLQKNSINLTMVRRVDTQSFSKINIPVDTLLDTVKANWWVYLSLAGQHYYYDVLSIEQCDKIWSRLFVSKNDSYTILPALLKMFQKVQCFISRDNFSNQEVLNIQVCGIKDEGRFVLNALREINSFTREVNDFYDMSTNSSEWEEGMYCIKAEEADKGYNNTVMCDLVCDPYFRSLDVTPFVAGHSSKENLVKYVLNIKESVYLYVNKVPDLICTKTLIWL